MKKIKMGEKVSSGIGVGKAYIYERYEPNIIESFIQADNCSLEFDKYQNIKKEAMKEIQAIHDMLYQSKDEKFKIFKAHLDIIDDIAIEDEIKNAIFDTHYTCSYSIQSVYNMFIEMFSEIEDDLIRERIADLKDVKLRLLRITDGVKESSLAYFDEDKIVIANDLYPSDTATLDRKHVKGIITEVGGKTSHTAIIAKSYEIPAILGVEQIRDIVQHDELVIVDALSDEIVLNPTQEVLEDYKEKQINDYNRKETLKKYLKEPSQTKDHVQIDLAINIGSASQEVLAFEPFVSSVGLFRTEFLYMEAESMPSEEKQFQVYKKIVERFKEKPVILRTLDIGGDKSLKYLELPKEDNPFLGKRAIRLCFDHLDMFKTQIRAALRAAQHGNLWLMFPMVGSLDDIYQLKALVTKVENELTEEGISYGKIKFGVMIEIPSLIFIADQVAKLVDFASIGTNDLTQYITAVDRMNQTISSYYQNYAPSVLRAIKQASDAFNALGKPLSICGELGGDVIGAPILIGLGIKKLSMNKASIANIKHMLHQYTYDELNQMSLKVLDFETEKEVKSFIIEKHDEKGVNYV